MSTSKSFTYNLGAPIAGTEGFCIIQIDGTVSSVTFNYTQSEYYSNVCFGLVDQNT